jgi:Tfp pilus assembly protein PilW
MTPRPTTTSRVRDHRGFTLVETLVAMLTGVAVTGALFAILEVSIHQTARINDVAQANQLGRTAMTRIVDELHSACIGQGFAPIQERSTERELRFVTAYSESSVIPASAVSEHLIVWSESAQTLTDFTYPASSGEATNFVFPTTASPAKGTLVAEHVARGESGGTPKPIFRYYKYASTPTSSSETPEGTLSEVVLASETTALAATANEVAAVTVTFKTGPTDTTVWKGRVPSEFSAQNTFAFSEPAAEAPVQDAPCQ